MPWRMALVTVMAGLALSAVGCKLPLGMASNAAEDPFLVHHEGPDYPAGMASVAGVDSEDAVEHGAARVSSADGGDVPSAAELRD